MALGAVVGALRVNLGLNSAEFDRKLKRANRQAEAFASGIGTAIGAAIATVSTGLAVMAGSIINGSSELQKMIDISNSSAIEFQRFAAAASTVGIENEKLADIFKDVNDRVGDFVQTGGGPMADFFEKIGPKVGVTAESFRNLSGPQALGLFVDSLQKAGVSQQDMTFYMEAMASDATALIPLLKDNGAELNRLADAADRFGTFLTQEDLDLLTAAKTSIGDVWKGITGIATDIAVAIAPAVKSVADFFASMLEKGGPIRELLQGIIDNFRQVGITVGIAMAIAAAGVFGLQGALVLATVALTAFKVALISTGIGAVAVAIGYLVEQFFVLAEEMGSFGATFQYVLDQVKLYAVQWSGVLAVIFVATLPTAIGATLTALNILRATLIATGVAALTGLGNSLLALGRIIPGIGLTSLGLAANNLAIGRTARAASFAVSAFSIALRAIPIIAVITAIAYLIQKFVETAYGLGSVSEAFKLWGELMLGVVQYVGGLFVTLKDGILAALGVIINYAINIAARLNVAFINTINAIVNLFEGLVGSVGAILETLPGIMAQVGARMANALVDAIQNAIGGVASALNSILEGVGLDPIAPPDLSGWKMAVPEAKGIGEAVSGAFNEAFSDNIMDPSSSQKIADGAMAAIAAVPGQMADSFERNTAPATSRIAAAWGKIKAAIKVSEGEVAPTTTEIPEATEELKELEDQLKEVETAAPPAGAALADGVGGGAGKAKDAVNDLNETLEERTKANLERMRDMFADTFTDIVTGTKSVRDAIADLLMDMAKAIASSAFKEFFGTLFGGGGGGGGGFWGSVANFLFGGLGANANGTNNWRGGLTEVNERGSEIMNLPSGTQIIPADLSRRMANAGGGGSSTIQIDLGPDLEARILKQAETQSLRITEGGLKSYDANVMPRRVAQISNDPRRIG